MTGVLILIDNEIKTYDKSPDNLLGTENEKVVYKWKFKLDDGFQSSSNFTHIHQLKSVGGNLESMPMYTLTTRKSSPDRIELRYAETDNQVTLLKKDLEPFIGSWLSVTEKIKYGIAGTYEIEIKRVSDDAVLLAYSNQSIVNWRSEADFVRPKWGIYRSLNNVQDLRDETLLFANFSIEEVDELSIEDLGINSSKIIFPNPIFNTILIKNAPKKIKSIQIFSLEGVKILEKNYNSETEINLDVSFFATGTYVLNIKGEQYNQSELVIIL